MLKEVNEKDIKIGLYINFKKIQVMLNSFSGREESFYYMRTLLKKLTTSIS